MSQVEASIGAIEALRQALDIFRFKQKEVVARTQYEIDATIASIDRAEHRWTLEVDRCVAALNDCLRQAAYAAREGHYVDCSPWERALHHAENRLSEVRRLRGEVERQVDTYRSNAQTFAHQIDYELPRATGYLDDIISGLRAFHKI